MAAALLDASLVDFRGLGVRWRIAWSLCARALGRVAPGRSPRRARPLRGGAHRRERGGRQALRVELPRSARTCRAGSRSSGAGRASCSERRFVCATSRAPAWPAFVEADFDEAIARAGSQLDAEARSPRHGRRGARQTRRMRFGASRVPLPEQSRTERRAFSRRERRRYSGSSPPTSPTCRSPSSSSSVPRTIHSHLRSIYRKLGVSSRRAATRYAIEHGLSSDAGGDAAFGRRRVEPGRSGLREGRDPVARRCSAAAQSHGHADRRQPIKTNLELSLDTFRANVKPSRSEIT